MSAYQQFLDFFEMHNKERLDGLSVDYFTPMTPHERAMAFDYLAQRLVDGGSEEAVNGLFRADPVRASAVVAGLLDAGALRAEAQIAAAWNLYGVSKDPALLDIFIRHLSDANPEVRGKAAYYVPSSLLTDALKQALQGMIRTETDRLALVHAVNKLLECYGITREAVDKAEFSRYYKGLRSEDSSTLEATFKLLDGLFS